MASVLPRVTFTHFCVRPEASSGCFTSVSTCVTPNRTVQGFPAREVVLVILFASRHVPGRRMLGSDSSALCPPPKYLYLLDCAGSERASGFRLDSDNFTIYLVVAMTHFMTGTAERTMSIQEASSKLCCKGDSQQEWWRTPAVRAKAWPRQRGLA